MTRSGAEWRRQAEGWDWGMARLGMARRGMARGKARLGPVCVGQVSHGMAGEAWSGTSWRGVVCNGLAWGPRHGPVRRGTGCGHVWSREVRRGLG